MDRYEASSPRPQRPRRRKLSQIDIFKQTYLPALIVCVALILIVIIVIGSISRGIQKWKLEKDGFTQSQQVQQSAYDKTVQSAKAYAAGYDYENAIAVLEQFTGNASDYPQIDQLKSEYEAAKAALVLWEDNRTIKNLSFQQLIADPQRAFIDATNGSSYKKNHITTTEFTNLLQQLYENNYVLVSLDDIASHDDSGDDSTYFNSKELYLPEGKKPLLITQTQVNYYTKTVDGDGDKFPDKDGDGFASCLTLDANGNLACEIVMTDGTTETGAYDLVPLLESFITTHPDFSYKGARAILAVTGFDGLFGYRTSAAAGEHFGSAYQEKQISAAKKVIAALQDTGYDIACCTYGDVAYGSATPEEITADMARWTEEVVPVLGETEIFVFLKESDIGSVNKMYSGNKYDILADLGFKYYIGYCANGEPWQLLTDDYMRQGRMYVSGANITNRPEWFADMFDAAAILDPTR